jgi:electron transport complex protein RnfB
MGTAWFAILPPLFTLAGIGVGTGALLSWLAGRLRPDTDPVIDRINMILPQTQCGQCGYPGCKPYAEAVAAGEAINKCPPGGEDTIIALAGLLNLEPLLLDPSHGLEETRKVAFIREDECIGCAKCIPACPVDAILGANKYMHTVISEECTGCDLCVEPCPVDCIDMIPASQAYPPADLSFLADAKSCINCGLCIDECPVQLLPHELYRACRREDLDTAVQLNLSDCIECSKCDRACPENLPLTESYQAAKQQILYLGDEKRRADAAKARFEEHQQRQAKRDAEEEQRRLRRAELASQNKKASSDNIKAALERVKAKRLNKD